MKLEAYVDLRSKAARTRSEMNQREHFHAKASRTAKQRKAAYLALRAETYTPPPPPLVIRMTRIASRPIKDGDNLQSAFKAVRDGIADFLKIDDGDDRLQWVVAQRKGKPRQHGVWVEISWREP